jgi:signal transduction histidine kinase
LLFKPFQRTSVKSTGGEKSSGLGLVIAKRIVNGHAGRIWVESQVGIGSTFFVAIPIQNG